MYLLIEFNLMIYCSSVIHHCVIMCSFFVELPSFFLPLLQTNHVDLCMRVFWTIPWSRVINFIHQQQLPLSLSAAVGPAHEGLTPPMGKAQTPVTTENWHPMWGLWLVAETQSTSASSRSATRRPTAKSYENRFISAKEHQRTYDFARAADRPTQQCAPPSQVHRRGSVGKLCPVNIGGRWLRTSDEGT